MLDEKNSQKVMKAQQKLDAAVLNFDQECEVVPNVRAIQCSTQKLMLKTCYLIYKR